MKSRLLPVLLILAIGCPVRADDSRQSDDRLLGEAGIGREGPALLAFFRQRTPTDEQRREIAELIQQLGSDSFRDRQQATKRLTQFGLTAVGMLKQASNKDDPEIARRSEQVLAQIEKVPTNVLAAAVARMLARVKPEGAAEVILAQLPAADDEVVADALREALAAVAQRDRDVLLTALDAEQPVRRAAAGEALLKARVESVESRVRALLKDRDAGVRFRVAMALVTATRDRTAVGELIGMLADAPVNDVWRAEDLLRQLAGDDAPKLAVQGEAADRQKARDAWAEWWANAGSTVDLKKLDEGPRTFGYTLILQIASDGSGGEACELAPDGKTVRWRIKGLQLPVDAQVLPSDRLLVADFNANLVTERELDGTIRRRWNIDQPVACERLPNGNTFIAYRRGLVEFDTRDQRVFSYRRDQDEIISGRKARDGSYIFVTRGGQCIRLDAKGQVVKSFPVGRLYIYGSLELLPDNRVLVSHLTGIAEYDLATGEQRWSATPSRGITSAQRLSNGHTLVTSTTSQRVFELDRDGKQIKEITLPNGAIPWRIRRR